MIARNTSPRKGRGIKVLYRCRAPEFPEPCAFEYESAVVLVLVVLILVAVLVLIGVFLILVLVLIIALLHVLASFRFSCLQT